MRKEDFGVNDTTYIVNTHLGEVLNFNDTVLAYDIVQCNTSDLEVYAQVDAYIPDFVIVKKTYPKFRKRQKNRIWKLKHFEDQQKQRDAEEAVNAVEEKPVEEEEDEDARKKKTEKKISKKAQKRNARQDKTDVKTGKDYELFLQDLEDDPEYRSNVNLYKDDDVIG